jgi:copper resistance protein B
MRLAVILLAMAAALPAPALAQHEDHGAHGHQGPEPAAHDHEGHAAPAPSPTPAPAHAHEEHAEADAHAPPMAGPPAEASSGPENAADIYFGHAAMEQARRELGRTHGNLPAYRVLIDRLEAHTGDGTDRYLFDAQAWYGGDIDKLWLKAEGEGAFGDAFEGAELQALWSHAIGPWFDLQTGARYDARQGKDRAHFVLGVQGLAPYWVELEAAAFLSDRGDLTARLEAEHDARITQRLILQPRAELNFSFQTVREDQIGSGLTTAAFGARLRYQVTPLLGPYVGIEYERAFGGTRKLRAAAGEDLGGVSVLAGIRAWF